MPVIKHNPEGLFPQDRCYSHAIEIRGNARLPNVHMRVKILGTHEPASTVVCCQLLDPKWKLEIEAMAAREGER